MLFKNNMTPAYAYAGYTDSKSESKKENEGITLMASKDDDFENYSSQKSAPKKKPQQKKGNHPQKKSSHAHKSSRKFLPIVFAIIAIVAIVVIIAIIVAIINAPGSNMKKDDTVFFAYKDTDEKYHVIVDDEKKEDIVFDNKIELIPAANNTFAYIFEEDPENNGTKIHILDADADELDTSMRTATEILKYSTLSPCVIYKIESINKDADDTIYCFKGGRDDNPLSSNPSADNFVIADDASSVYFTIGEASPKLLKYSNSVLTDLYDKPLIPKAVSPDGRYLYGTPANGTALYYIDTEKTNDEGKVGAIEIKISSGIFCDITAMNADGNQIIFATRAMNGSKLTSHFYEIGDEKATQLADGLFKSVHPDPVVIFEDSLLDSFFEADTSVIINDEGEYEIEEDDDDDDDDSIKTSKASTYFLSNKKEAVQIANTLGKFSPNGKHFYYIDETQILKRISLSSRKFDKSENISLDVKVVDFSITQKGDIYAFYKDASTPDGTLSIVFYESSDPKPTPITTQADIGSICISVNTLYFSETRTDNDGQTAKKVYSTTDGSEKNLADFDNIELTQAPTFQMGAGKKGYAFVTNESSNETRLFYTSSGKSFQRICSCYLIDEKQSSKK